MLLEIIIFSGGVVLGFAVCSERMQSKEQKTFEQVDKEVRKELTRLQNLTNSLKDDVAYLRKKLAAAQAQLNDRTSGKQ